MPTARIGIHIARWRCGLWRQFCVELSPWGADGALTTWSWNKLLVFGVSAGLGSGKSFWSGKDLDGAFMGTEPIILDLGCDAQQNIVLEPWRHHCHLPGHCLCCYRGHHSHIICFLALWLVPGRFWLKKRFSDRSQHRDQKQLHCYRCSCCCCHRHRRGSTPPPKYDPVTQASQRGLHPEKRPCCGFCLHHTKSIWKQ